MACVQVCVLRTCMHVAYQVRRASCGSVCVLHTSMRGCIRKALTWYAICIRSVFVSHTSMLPAYKYAPCIPGQSVVQKGCVQVCALHTRSEGVFRMACIQVCVSHTSMHRCILSARLCNKSFRRSGFSACRKSQFRQLRCCTALTCKGSGAWNGWEAGWLRHAPQLGEWAEGYNFVEGGRR